MLKLPVTSPPANVTVLAVCHLLAVAACKLATAVVEVTVNGAVPVAIVLINCVALTVPVAVAIFPPTLTFSNTPSPPVTFNAPVVELLDPVALVILMALVVVAPRLVTVCSVDVTARSIFPVTGLPRSS